MKFDRTLLLAAFVSLGIALSGCATVSGDTAKTTSASPLVIEVSGPPPPALDEAKPTTPEPGHIWVAGYWDYLDGHHVWREGRWVQGKAGYEYVRARYEWDGKSWQFHVPHWHRRQPSAPTAVAAMQR